MKARLFRKRVFVFVTNRCNLSCGGCYQQCGNLPDELLWDTPIDDFRSNLKFLFDNRKRLSLSPQGRGLGIIGGEPSKHQRFDELLESMYEYEGRLTFQIYVNSERFTNHRNIKFRPDTKYNGKSAHNQSGFTPTLIAPSDVLGIDDRSYYVDQARKHCRYFRTCGIMLYRNKVYACQPAVMFDTLLGRTTGWPLDESLFDRTEEDVNKQLEPYCHRCAWSISKSERERLGIQNQSILEPSLISITNAELPIKESAKWG